MIPDPKPPRLADALLKRVLPTGKRGDSILGDLREEFREMVDKPNCLALPAWRASRIDPVTALRSE